MKNVKSFFLGLFLTICTVAPCLAQGVTVQNALYARADIINQGERAVVCLCQGPYIEKDGVSADNPPQSIFTITAAPNDTYEVGRSFYVDGSIQLTDPRASANPHPAFTGTIPDPINPTQTKTVNIPAVPGIFR